MKPLDLRPISFGIQNIYNALGIENCAAAMDRSSSRSYKWGEPATGSGEPIPLENLVRLMGYVGKSGNLVAIKAAMGIGQNIMGPVGAVVVDKLLVGSAVIGTPLSSLSEHRPEPAQCPNGHGEMQGVFACFRCSYGDRWEELVK